MLALLQFDAAALPVIDRMLAEGRLPVLAELRRQGHWHTIDAAATVLQSSTYPTLYTGVDVRRHGIYSTYPWSPHDQRSRHVRSVATPRTIWERLTEAGSRALVVDPYISWPPDEMAGVFLSGWQFEDRMTLRAGSVPREVRPALVHRHGRPPRLDDVYGPRQIDGLTRELDRLVAAPGRTAQAVIELLRREPFDVVWVTFAAAHKAGHQLWGDLPEGLEAVYVAVDRALGRIVAELPSGSDVLAFSPTGMGPNTSRAELLPGMLSRILAGDTVAEGGSGAPIWGLRAAVPPGIRAAAALALPDRLIADLTTRLHARADWSSTRAFTVAGENKGYIRLNQRGRERDGIVAETEAAGLLDTIADGLVRLVRPGRRRLRDGGDPDGGSRGRRSGLPDASRPGRRLGRSAGRGDHARHLAPVRHRSSRRWRQRPRGQPCRRRLGAGRSRGRTASRAGPVAADHGYRCDCLRALRRRRHRTVGREPARVAVAAATDAQP